MLCDVINYSEHVDYQCNLDDAYQHDELLVENCPDEISNLQDHPLHTATFSGTPHIKHSLRYLGKSS